MVDYLLVEVGVVLLFGIVYGKFGDGYLRLFYVNFIENICEGISWIEIAIVKL